MKFLLAIPAYNEEAVIRGTTLGAHRFLAENLALADWRIVVADNGSTDATGAIAAELAADLPRVRHLSVSQKGKGSAVRAAWNSDDADIYAFMDADAATDISALPRLVAAVARGADMAVGSRFHPDSTVERTPHRRILSLGYRLALKALFGTGVRDVPCGFKAASRRVITEVLPFVRDNEWFFDTELVLRAEENNMAIEEIPVIWRERAVAGRESKVAAVSVVAEYVRKMVKLRGEL